MRPATLLLLSAAALTLPGPARGQRPPAGFEVVARIPGVIATGINAGGDVVGFLWEEEAERPGVVAQVPVYLEGEAVTRLPLLEGYTSTFPAAVSDGGLVVGRVSKPLIPGVEVDLQNQAFAWDAEGGIRGLGVLEGGIASLATGVSADGARISGIMLFEGHMEPCVWDRDGDGDGWRATTLPTERGLGSNVVAISGDGRRVSAVDGALPCLWTADGSGGWAREAIAGPGSLLPRGVNDSGMVVGLRFDDGGRAHAVVWTRDGGHRQLEEPEGYVKSEAAAVNDSGMVVGMVDGPSGSDIYPRAFIYQNEKMTLIPEGSPVFATATAVNDNGQVAGVVEEADEVEGPAGRPAP
ncbi:HAF repeat-containing protein [Tautonia plasticadhaerens]|uniref:Extracellular repeat protein, HAF family n=1 Tax=Tautonia plasticadhaerens TaxID=2527974 RepID=A0A518H3R2_9BACT|nr:HAF repeat-containing protein [Tautonia plasticadhaerens]QDV35442.1 hypothetical protein ElP_33450 [Tautonia plasticadhaerens]